MAHPSLLITEALIRRNVSDRTFERGREYFDDGQVASVFLRDGALYAEVQGSAEEPYRVAIRSSATDTTATCDCPYDYEGWCKHIVAALFFALETPGDVEEKPSVVALIEAAGLCDVKRLLTEIALLDPEIADMVKERLQAERLRGSAPRTV